MVVSLNLDTQKSTKICLLNFSQSAMRSSCLKIMIVEANMAAQVEEGVEENGEKSLEKCRKKNWGSRPYQNKTQSC